MIDAKFGGNSARWINHSCDPNCFADEVDGRIFITALRNIAGGRRNQLRLRPHHRRALQPQAQAEYPAGAALRPAGAPCWRQSAAGWRRGPCQGRSARQKRGTKAMTAPLRWPLEAVWEAVAPLLPGFTAELLPSVDSTNTELMRRARAGAATPCCWWPSSKRRTVGALGRAWHSQAGDSLTFRWACRWRLPTGRACRWPWGERGRKPAAHAAAARQCPAAHRPEMAQRPVAGGGVGATASWGHPGGNGQFRRAAVRPGSACARPVRGGRRGPERACPHDGAGMSLAARRPAGGGCAARCPTALLRIVAPLVGMLLQSFAAYGFAPMQPRFALRDVLQGRSVQRATAAAALRTVWRGWRPARAYCGRHAARDQFEISVRPVACNHALTFYNTHAAFLCSSCCWPTRVTTPGRRACCGWGWPRIPV